MVQRMTRAQRSAIGEAAVRAQSSTRKLTPGQAERVAQLRKDFGKAVLTVSTPLQSNEHVHVRLATGAGVTIWEFDQHGEYVQRYSQRALFVEGTSTDEP